MDFKETIKIRLFLKISIWNQKNQSKYFQEFIPLSEIPTWKNYYKENEKRLTSTKISEKELENFNLTNPDPIQNPQLADKLSLYHGDMTKLELDCIANAGSLIFARNWESGESVIDIFLHL